MGKTRYFCLSRDFMSGPGKEQFTITEISACSEEAAWDVVEDSISTNTSQDWLMTRKELKLLAEKINKEV